VALAPVELVKEALGPYLVFVEAGRGAVPKFEVDLLLLRCPLELPEPLPEPHAR
jgi:hypothetical protein